MLDGWQGLILTGQPVTLYARDVLISVQKIFCEKLISEKLYWDFKKDLTKLCYLLHYMSSSSDLYSGFQASAHLKFMTSIVASLLLALISCF